LKQAIRKYIFRTSYHDHILAESVCTVTSSQLYDVGVKYYEQINPNDAEMGKKVNAAIPDVEKGLILSDSRGRGVFQK